MLGESVNSHTVARVEERVMKRREDGRLNEEPHGLKTAGIDWDYCNLKLKYRRG